MNLKNISLIFIFLIFFLVITLSYYNKFLINYGPILALITVQTTKTISNTTKTASIATTRIEVNDYIEITKQNTVNDLLIVSISNYGFKNLTLNWITNLYKLGFNKFVVFCFDQELYEFLSEKGYKNNLAIVPSNWLDFKISKSFSSWATKDYNQITQAKPQIWYQLLKLKLNIFFSDSDVAWLNKNIIDHLKFIYEYSTADLLFSVDQEHRNNYYNTGLFMAKCTPYSIDLFLNLINEQRKSPEHSIDQIVLGNMLKKTKFNDSRIIGLDPILFASGKVFLHDKLNKRFNLTPYTFHANYLVGIEAKINALKANNLWFL
jgi:hypothetical protein